MESIAFVQTGGSIDKDYPKTILGYSFEISPVPASEKILNKFNPGVNFDFKIIKALRKDSQEITNQDREELAKIIKDLSETKVVVTHGTDTMIDTAVALHEKNLDKVIVVTGAFLPERLKDSDADFNLGFAACAVQIICNPGVYVAMNGSLIPATKAGRDPDSGCFAQHFRL